MRSVLRYGWWGLVVLIGCGRTDYRTPSGLIFHVYSTSATQGPIAAGGSTVKETYTLLHGDSAIQSTQGKMPLYKALIPGMIFPYTPEEVLGYGVHAGDSVVVEERVDSLLRKGYLKALPVGWKRDDVLEARMHVLAIFPFQMGGRDSALQADKVKEAKMLLWQDSLAGTTRLAKYLQDNGVQAHYLPGGTFLAVLSYGSGAKIDSGSSVGLRYSVASLAGRVIDANTDSAFHHPLVLKCVIGAHVLPPFVERSLLGVPQGSHLKVYIPKGVGIGPGAVIAQGKVPGEDWVWDIQL